MNCPKITVLTIALASLCVCAANVEANAQNTSPNDSTVDTALIVAFRSRTPTSPAQADPASVSMNTPVSRLPAGAFFEGTRFNARQLRALDGAGITTARDLIEADPVALGRLLDIEPREASINQQNLQKNAEQRTPASRPSQPARNLGMNSSIRQIPGDSFLSGGRLRNAQISALEEADIRTVRDLVGANAVALGRLLDIEPRQAALAQRRLKDYIRDNRGVSSRDHARAALSPDTSVAAMPAGVFLNSRFNRSQIRAMQDAGIETAGDLAEANVNRIAQIFRMRNIDEARAARGRLQKALYD